MVRQSSSYNFITGNQVRYDDSLGLQVKEDGKDDKKMQTLAKKEK